MCLITVVAAMQKPKASGDEGRQRQRNDQRDFQFCNEHQGGKSPDGKKAGVAHGDLAGITHQDVQSDDYDAVDNDQIDEVNGETQKVRLLHDPG